MHEMQEGQVPGGVYEDKKRGGEDYRRLSFVMSRGEGQADLGVWVRASGCSSRVLI
jgi:hypothetical protein